MDLANESGDFIDSEALLRSENFDQLWKLLQRRHSCWRQKSRANWFKFGDANTAFFHKAAAFINRCNSIQGLNVNGTWTENPAEIRQEAVNYFRNRFTPAIIPYVKFPILPSKKLSTIGSTLLVREFSMEEIKTTGWGCGEDKALGPDGFNFHIIKSLWDTIATYIKQFVDEFHTNGKLVRGLNSSFITLIPKKQNPLSLDEFRPISLISSLYKIISKCLANRLREVIEKIISPAESTFISGRNISESIMACNEMLHLLKKNGSGSFAFKVDFEKAFDCVRWDFLIEMMSNMGFNQTWINWVKECLSSASVSVLI